MWIWATAVVVAVVLNLAAERRSGPAIRNDQTRLADSKVRASEAVTDHVHASGSSGPSIGRSASAGQDAGPEFGGQRAIGAELGRMLVSDPRAFLGSSQVRSVEKNGQPGLYLLALDPSCGAAAMGVSTGDVLVNVNGSALASSEDVTRPSTWDSFAEFGEGALFLLRGERALTIDYAIDDPHWVVASE